MTKDPQNQRTKKQTCITMRGNTVCKMPTATGGAGVLCHQHLLLHQSGRYLRFKGNRTKTQQATLDALKRADDKDDDAKKDEKPFYLKPPAVLTAIFAVSLFCIERIQSLILDVPSSLTIGGYDMTAAAIQNAGLGLLVFAFAVLLILMSGAVLSGFCLAAVAAGSWGLTAVAFVDSRFFAFLAWCFLSCKPDDTMSAEQLGQESWSRRVTKMFRKGLYSERDKSRANFEKHHESTGKNVGSAWNVIRDFWVWFWNGIICSDRSYRFTGYGQSVLLITLFSVALIFAAEAAHDRNNLIRDIATDARKVKQPDTPEVHAASDQKPPEDSAANSPSGVPEVGCAPGRTTAAEDQELFNSVANVLYDRLSGLICGPVLLRMVSSEPQLGMMTFARQPAPRATLLDVAAKRSGENGFRTEKLIYIGDFGDWAFIARLNPPKERILVRRSTIIEFSRESGAKLTFNGQDNDAGTPISVGSGNRLDVTLNFPRQGGLPRITTADIEGLEGKLLRVSSEISRNHIMLQLLAAGRPYRHSPQSDLAPVLERLANVQEVLAQDTRQLKDGQDWLSATALGLTFRLSVLQNSAHRILAHLRSGLPKSGPYPWTGVDGVIQDGVPIRASGIINDIARSNGKGYLTGCASNQTEHLGFVDFREGISNAPERPADIGALVTKLRELKAGDSEQNTKAQLVFLRGGASYTGMPEANIRISENRAELVKRRLLLALTGKTHGDPTELELDVQKSHRINFIAFGVGERLHHSKHSSRAVEAILCKSANEHGYAQGKTGMNEITGLAASHVAQPKPAKHMHQQP